MTNLALQTAPLTASQRRLLTEIADPEKTVIYNGRGRVFARDDLLSAAQGKQVGMSFSEKTAESLVACGMAVEIEQYGELTLQLRADNLVIDLTM